MAKLTLIRGLPGSGKSTIAKRLAEETGACHFEADMYFMFDGYYLYDKSNIRHAHRWCQNQTLKALNSGLNVVVSNTFTELWELQAYLDMNFPVEVLKATGTFKNKHDVPDSVIRNMNNRWEDFEGEKEITLD